MQNPIVVVGSINLDLVAGADRIPQVGETVIGHSFHTFYGGKGGNQAVAAAKLGYPVALLGCVGSDPFGKQLRAGLDNAGVDTTYVNTVEGESGVALITTGRSGENNIVVVPGANAQLTPDALQKASPLLERAGILLAQLEIPLETVDCLAQFAERHGIPLILDPAPARDLPTTLLQRLNWLTPNETETRELLHRDFAEGEKGFDAAADQLLQRGAQNVLLKLGTSGCLIARGKAAQGNAAASNATQDKAAKLRVPAFSVQAVDTTAAGDAFNAGFAVALMRGSTVEQSAVFASAVAAVSVTRHGAQPSMPDLNEVNAFLRAQPAP